MFVLFTILGGMAVLIRERQQWTLQRLVVMPVSRAEILGGKILAYFTLGLIQFAVVFLIGFGFGLDYGSNWIGIILIAISFSLAATALTFMLATLLRTEGQAGQLTTLLGLSLAALGGAWWPLDIVPDFMKTIGHLLADCMGYGRFSRHHLVQSRIDGCATRSRCIAGNCRRSIPDSHRQFQIRVTL